MIYDIKTLQGIAHLTTEWADRREDFYDYACSNGGERWAEESFRSYMYFEYIKNETPITLRLYSLDQGNLRILLDYVNNRLMSGMATREEEF